MTRESVGITVNNSLMGLVHKGVFMMRIALGIASLAASTFV